VLNQPHTRHKVKPKKYVFFTTLLGRYGGHPRFFFWLADLDVVAMYFFLLACGSMLQ
jgi:hypothetical protein